MYVSQRQAFCQLFSRPFVFGGLGDLGLCHGKTGNPRVELITDFMEHGSNVSSGASNFRILRVLRMGQRQKRENTRGEKRRQ